MILVFNWSIFYSGGVGENLLALGFQFNDTTCEIRWKFRTQDPIQRFEFLKETDLGLVIGEREGEWLVCHRVGAETLYERGINWWIHIRDYQCEHKQS